MDKEKIMFETAAQLDQLTDEANTKKALKALLCEYRKLAYETNQPHAEPEAVIFAASLVLDTEDAPKEGYDWCQRCGEDTWSFELHQCERCGFTD